MMSKDQFLGEFEQFLLLAILKLRDSAYGSSIRQLLAETIERDVTIGALYTTLERLESKGLVESKMGEATPERGGRAKKYFKVTAQGQMCTKAFQRCTCKHVARPGIAGEHMNPITTQPPVWPGRFLQWVLPSALKEPILGDLTAILTGIFSSLIGAIAIGSHLQAGDFSTTFGPDSRYAS